MPTRCKCTQQDLPHNPHAAPGQSSLGALFISGIVHTYSDCYSLVGEWQQQEKIVAVYIGSERGVEWKKDQRYELSVIDMSVFDNANNCWYTYTSIQHFLKNWIVTGKRG